MVDIDYFLQRTIYLQSDHNKNCTGGRLEIIEEIRTGLHSEFIFECNMCKKTLTVPSEKPGGTKIINQAAVWGTLATGSTYAHLAEQLSTMDIPPLSRRMFYNTQRSLGKVPITEFCEEM